MQDHVVAAAVDWVEKHLGSRPIDIFIAGYVHSDARLQQKVSERQLVDGLRNRNIILVLNRVRQELLDEMRLLKKFGVDESSRRYQSKAILIAEIDAVINFGDA